MRQERLQAARTAMNGGNTTEQLCQLMRYVSAMLRRWSTEIHDQTEPEAILDSGLALANHQVAIFAYFVKELLGLQTRLLHLTHDSGVDGHFVAEVNYLERWHLFDVWHNFCAMREGLPLSFREIQACLPDLPLVQQALAANPWTWHSVANGKGPEGFYSPQASVTYYGFADPINLKTIYQVIPTTGLAFWEGLPALSSFLADDRENPARAAAAATIAALGPVSLVEVGPGSGYDLGDHFMPLVAAGMRYVGYEPTRKLREYLQQVYKHPRVSILAGSFDELPLRGFDVAYTKATFEHLPDCRKAIKRFVQAAQRLAIVNWYRPPEPVAELNYIDGVHYNTYAVADVMSAVQGLYGRLERRMVGTNELWVFYL